MISEQVNQGLAYLEKEGVGACTDNDVCCLVLRTAVCCAAVCCAAVCI